MSYVNCYVLGQDVCVRLDYNATYGIVASEALRIACIRQTHSNPQRDISLLSSAYRLLSVIDGVTRMTHSLADDVDISALNKGELHVIVQGHFSTLSDHLLRHIAGYFSFTPNGTGTLQKLSRKFRKMFQSDLVWRNVITSYPFEGAGCDGTDEEEWCTYRITHGLPRFNNERIRALAHTSSRLRLFYGGLPPPSTSSDDVLNMLHRWTAAPPTPTHASTHSSTHASASALRSRNLVIVLGRTGQSSGKDVHTAMHFVVPPSAKDYHHQRPACKSVLRNGRCVKTEASPPSARAKFQVDPGTLIEEAPITNDFIFRIRRIGDERLTFVQFNHDPANEPDDRSVHSAITGAIDRVAGFVIVLDFDYDCEDEFFANLGSIFGEFVSTQRRIIRNSNNGEPGGKGGWSSSIHGQGQGPPLLIMLAIDFTSSTSFVSASDDDMELEKKIFISTAVARVHAFLRDSLTLVEPSFSWYIQPYDRVVLRQLLQQLHPRVTRRGNSDPLAHGFYAGINWLVRAMQRQRTTVNGGD